MLAIERPVWTTTDCSSLVRELQQIWSDIGESEAEKDRMLLDLERECLEVYRRWVGEAANVKACLHQTIAAKEAELAILTAALGEFGPPSQVQSYKGFVSLKDQLASVTQLLDDLRVKKDERMQRFEDVKAQIEKISGEISGSNHLNNNFGSLTVEEHDLSQRRLTEYQTHLCFLQKEKSDRLKKVLDYVSEVHSLCGVLGLDFSKTVCEVHPSLHGEAQDQFSNINNSTLLGLEQTIQKLKVERETRILKLKDIAASLFELWNLMDLPREEKNEFLRITSILGSSDKEITELGVLSTEMIEQASAEVERLIKMKAIRMKELVMKKRADLEEIFRAAHIELDTNTGAEKFNALLDSGLVDPSELLENIELQIGKAKKEAFSRKEIMYKIDRWLSACEEENWLEDYNQDENRYGAGKGTHINLKRAERARVTVIKIPGIVNSLINKILAWEKEKSRPFLYDGVSLISILEDYKLTRQQKDEEKKRYRDQKKLHGLFLLEKEAMYGSKPSPRKSNFRKSNVHCADGNGSMTPTPGCNSVSPKSELLTPRSYSGRSKGYIKETRRLSTAPLNFVALSKEDIMSFPSVSGSEPESPQS